MGFINEWVSEEDVEKYGLRELNKFWFKGDSSYNWTVDKERDIYLRHMRSGQGSECTDDNYFHFYWGGHICILNLWRDGGGQRDAPQWAIWTLMEFHLPDELSLNRTQVLEDLKEAFIARRGGGVYQTAPNIPLISKILTDRRGERYDIYF